MMKDFHFTVETSMAFDKVVRAVEEKMAKRASVSYFGLLHRHDVAATLGAKGFLREPLKIVEICNTRYASDVLKKDINVALSFHAPVYTQSGNTFTSTRLPSVLADFYPQAGIEDIAAKVEAKVLTLA
jgi:uncharacterized protein (DUF302 family)